LVFPYAWDIPSILKTRVKKDGLDFWWSKGAEVVDPEE
jgi:hypothetical protein